jgi:hypothetical protein
MDPWIEVTVVAPNANCKVRLLHDLVTVDEPARDENVHSTAGTVIIYRRTVRFVQVVRSC